MKEQLILATLIGFSASCVFCVTSTGKDLGGPEGDEFISNFSNFDFEESVEQEIEQKCEADYSCKELYKLEFEDWLKLGEKLKKVDGMTRLNICKNWLGTVEIKSWKVFIGELVRKNPKLKEIVLNSADEIDLRGLRSCDDKVYDNVLTEPQREALFSVDFLQSCDYGVWKRFR